MSDSYQGWTNYETWAVNLWLHNDEGRYKYWRDVAQRSPSSLDRMLRDEIEDRAPDLGASPYSDLLSHALGRVNWREIADGFLGGIEVEAEGEDEPDETGDEYY